MSTDHPTTTTQCVTVSSEAYCAPPCAAHKYTCLDDYLFRPTAPCQAGQYGCMCGRPDAYRNVVCCLPSACVDAPEQDTATAITFLNEFCTTFNHSVTLPRENNCTKWIKPDISPGPSDRQAAGPVPEDKVTIGGVVGGGLGGAALIAVGGVLIWRRQRKKKQRDLAAEAAAEREGRVPELGGKEHVPERHELNVTREPGELRELADTYLPVEMEASGSVRGRHELQGTPAVMRGTVELPIHDYGRESR